MNSSIHTFTSFLRGVCVTLLTAAALLLTATGTVHAEEIRLSMPDTTGLQGTQILMPVHIANTGVDDDIYSWQMEITYNASRLRNLGVVTENSLNEGSDHVVWSAPASGRLAVAAAAAEPMQDEGVLFYIRFELLSAVWSSPVNFTQSQTWLNDAGTIPLELQNGRITVQALPSFSVFPTQTTLFVGDSLDMRTSPVTQGVEWASEFSDVASVDEAGMVRALTYGASEITATDTNGVRNNNQARVNVRSVRLSTSSTEIFQGNTVVVPVYLENPLSHEITSAELDLTLSSTLIPEYNLLTDGSLLEGRHVSHHRSNNALSVAFALSEPLQTLPDTLQPLFYLELHSDRDRTGTTLSLGDILLNDTMAGLGQSGTFRVLSLPNVSVSPREPVLVAGQSQQFSASGTTGELQWSLSNPTVGTIDENGLLVTLSGGEVVVHVEDEIGAQASTNTFRVYDTHVHTPDTTLYSGDTHLIPVRIDALPDGKSMLAFEFDVQYNTSHITGLEPVSTGSMSQGWALSHNQVAGNRVRIAAAGTEPIDEPGTMLYLRIHTQAGVSTSFSSFSIPQIMLNEGDPAALTDTPNLRFTTVLGTTTLLSPANDSTGVPLQATLSWNLVNGATSYHVQVSQQNDFSEPHIDRQGVDGLSANVELDAATRYFWRVSAERDPDQMGSWSTAWSFTTEDRSVDAEIDDMEIPVRMALHQNYPNPFNPSTVIAYELPEALEVRIDIYDLTGRHIVTLQQGLKHAGRHEARFDASALSSGTYLYRLQAGDHVHSRAMMLMK